MDPRQIRIRDYTYQLPEEKIAAFPLEQRDASRLLVYRDGEISDQQFSNLPALVPANSTFIFNNTRVIEARILFQKETGGFIEIFCLEPFQKPIELALSDTTASQWKCMIGGASKWKPGKLLKKQITIGNTQVDFAATYVEKLQDSFLIEFNWTPAHFRFTEVIHAAGAIPLPPYIKRKAAEVDAERYQTVFSEHEGSVAAPTAALHFTKNVLQQLSEAGMKQAFVTLHVGAGTFKPVKTETIADHHMHAEVFSVSRNTLRQVVEAENIIAVGTTSLRTLESLHWLGVKLLSYGDTNYWELHQWENEKLNQAIDYKESYTAILNWMKEKDAEQINCRTSLIIVPGYRFKVASELVTNFHQPQSTLLLLIAAFVGEDWKKIYEHALNHNYRFLSYGDSSYLRRVEVQ